MAILKGINSKMQGSVGQWNYYQLNGQTVVKEKVMQNKSMTYAQMNHRVRWANLIHVWQVMSQSDHPSFENRKRYTSDFNQFMSVNIHAQPVYLTAGEARQGGCVVGDYQVTRGSLPSITVDKGENDIFFSSIAYDGQISASTTVKEFSDKVIASNGAFQNGDQLTAFKFIQMVDLVTGVPRVVFKRWEITLDTSDTTHSVRSFVSADLFTVVDGYIGASAVVDGGVCWIHSRKTAAGVKVSTQFIKTTNSILEDYGSAQRRIEAVKSYGGKTSCDYLTPNEGNEGTIVDNA